MKKICFYALSFVRLDTAPDPLGPYHRILAGDKVFRFRDSQFEDTSVLEKLTEGEQVFIGARPLRDGTYWLHWLASEKLGVTEPVKDKANNGDNLLKVGISAGVLALSVFGFFHIASFLAALIIFILFSGGCWFFISAMQALLVHNSPRMKALLAVLERVRAGDTGMCRTPEQLLPDNCAEDNSKYKQMQTGHDLDSVQPEDFRYGEKLALRRMRGEVSNLTARRDFTGSGKSRRDYIEYQFICNNIPFIWRYGVGSMDGDINPLFFRKAPFFLAEGDPVYLAINQKNGMIIGLYNERDNCAYLRPEGMVITSSQMKFGYKVLFWAGAGMWFLMLLFTLTDWMKADGGVDRWDIIYGAETLFNAGLLVTMIISGILLLMEISAVLVRKNSVRASRSVFVRRILTQLRQKHGKTDDIQEVY